MPRRPPGALRAQPRITRTSRPFSQIRGLNGSSRAAVERLEARRLGPGYVASALAMYADFLRQPGRWLFVRPLCPCHDNPIEARDQLEVALNGLPRQPRHDLARIVARLDDEFARRTRPTPRAWLSDRERARAWWHQRLRG